MEVFNFITIRLGKDSIPDIHAICSSQVGVLKKPFIIKVKCTQIPDNYGMGDFAFLWLGSDNNKGTPTKWKQGFKAVGQVKKVIRGKSYNDTSETAIEIIYIFHESINRMDILRCAPVAYYWCSSMPLIGLDDHANQTIRNMTGSTFADIRAFFSAIESVTNHFKEDILQIECKFEQYFDFVLPNPQSYPTVNNLNDINLIKHDSKKDSPLQQIFYGAPGTGKSNTIKREVEDKGRIHFRTTFHPDSDYSTFVGCYKPTMKLVKKTVVIGQDEKEVKPLPTGTDSVEQISYQFVPQAFTKAYCEAWNNYNPEGESKPVFLIIEEINRGNCAQIFGDIFQLLDRKDGFSEYPIDADEDLKKFLLNATKEDGTPWLVNKDGIKDGQLCLPPNLHIWATMNTSDQSLFPIDSAFKRRWDWKYVPIRNCPDKNWKIKIGEKEYDWWTFLQAINKSTFELTKSEDKKLGFFFCKAQNGIISAETFIGKVFFYLWNDVFKDYDYSPAFFRNENGELIEYSEYYNEGGDTPNIERIQDFIEKVEPKFKEILLNER